MINPFLRDPVKILLARPWYFFAIGYFLFSVPFVGRYPLPSGDEVIGNDAAAEWSLHGHLQLSLFAESPKFEHGYFLQPPGQVWSSAIAYTIAGVSIESTRIQALVWGAWAIGAWGGLAAAWTSSRRAGLLAAIMVACIPVFGNCVAAARPDGQALALVALALLLWLPGPEMPSRHPFLAGIVLGCAGLTHPVILFWAVGIFVGALVSARQPKSAVVWLVAGAAVPFAGWLAYAATNWTGFSDQFLNHGRGKLGGRDLIALASGELRRTAMSFAQQPLLPLLYVAGAFSWWVRFRSLPDFRRETSVLVGVVVLGVTFLLEKSSGPHGLYHAALLSVGAAALLDAMIAQDGSPSIWPRKFAVGLTAVIATIGVARWSLPRIAALGPQRAARDYAAFTHQIASVIPPGSNVVGEPVSYYAVRESGSWLRFGAAPDPHRHHFVISPARTPWQLSDDFETIAVAGRPLPTWLGRTFCPPGDQLYVTIARSRLLPAPTR